MKKQNDILKKIIIFLAIFFVLELLYFGIRLNHIRKTTTYYTVVNNAIIENEKNYLGVGFSDFRYSKFNKFDKGYEKAIIETVENGKTTKEVAFKKGYNSRFNDVVETDDGYVVVGQVEMTKEQNKEGMSEGIIIKYDKDFKQVWRKNVSILEKTELKKVELDGDDIVVVGSSVYSSGYIGNHTTGGGILLRYDKDGNQKLKVNNGGPYTGSFNDIIVEDDSYIVVGLGKSYSGIIIRYDKKGNKKDSGSFGYTDKTGINAIAKKGNTYVTATTKVVNTKDLSKYSAAIVEFDKNLEVVNDTKYNDKDITYFNDIAVDTDENVYASGYTGVPVDKKVLTDAIVIKFDKDLLQDKDEIVEGNNNDYYSHLYLNNDKLFALGYSNSKLKQFKVNGFDYSPIIKDYSNLK